MFIYRIVNSVTGKCYVGQTTQSLRRRFQAHLDAARRKTYISALGAAIRKYGRENFIIEQLQSCSSVEELNEAERYWIERLNCYAPSGYNIREGGGSRGRMAESTKVKMRWKRFSLDHRLKISAACRGRKGNSGSFTPERVRGEGTNHHKLTWAQVREIRRLYSVRALTQKQLAERYSVGQPNISRILRNIQWVDDSYTPHAYRLRGA